MHWLAGVPGFISYSSKNHTQTKLCVYVHTQLTFFLHFITMTFEMFCEQWRAFIYFFLKSVVYPNYLYSGCKMLSPSRNVVNFITAGQPLEHEEQNVGLIAPFLQMHPEHIKRTSQCAAMAAVVVGRRTALVWLL